MDEAWKENLMTLLTRLVVDYWNIEKDSNTEKVQK